MKKLLTVGLVSLGLVSTSVFAGTENYTSQKYNIQLVTGKRGMIKIWNKPKRIGQGKPDRTFRVSFTNANCCRWDNIVEDGPVYVSLIRKKDRCGCLDPSQKSYSKLDGTLQIGDSDEFPIYRK